MCLVSKCEHLTIASTVAKGCEMISRTVRMEGKDTTHFLLAVTIGSEETTCQTTIDNLYLSAHNLYLGKERLYPVVDARADNEHLSALRQSLL